jgi:hypothetical protein
MLGDEQWCNQRKMVCAVGPGAKCCDTWREGLMDLTKNFGERSEARKRRSVFSEVSLSNGNL